MIVSKIIRDDYKKKRDTYILKFSNFSVNQKIISKKQIYVQDIYLWDFILPDNSRFVDFKSYNFDYILFYSFIIAAEEN